jgi:hypothetical protein
MKVFFECMCVCTWLEDSKIFMEIQRSMSIWDVLKKEKYIWLFLLDINDKYSPVKHRENMFFFKWRVLGQFFAKLQSKYDR